MAWSAERRRQALAEGHALPPKHPGGEPRYPIEDCDDVQNAIHDLGRTEEPERQFVRRYITRRAIALGCELPDSWRIERGNDPQSS